jgi:DNA uptake protein ComE-like DNA-binding protein
MLGTLPNMTQQIGANIYAWQSSSASTDGGASSEYYQALPTPYRAKGRPFESVEELLMVKDVTVSLLYGNDTNRNGVIDAADQDSSTISGATAGSAARGAPGQRIAGLSEFVTAYTIEPRPGRWDVNAPSRDALRQTLTSAGLSNELAQQVSGRVFVRGQRVLGPFRSPLDFYFQSGLQAAQFRPIADQLTANGAPGSDVRLGLVNLSTAPVEVIACLPGLTQSDAQAIVAARPSQGGFTSIADLIPLLNAAKARAMGRLITIKSYQCSADVVACDSTGRAFKRYAVVIDASVSPPRVLHFRDLTALGWPLDPAILTDLRAGVAIASGMGTSSSTSSALGAR